MFQILGGQYEYSHNDLIFSDGRAQHVLAAEDPPLHGGGGADGGQARQEAGRHRGRRRPRPALCRGKRRSLGPARQPRPGRRLGAPHGAGAGGEGEGGRGSHAVRAALVRRRRRRARRRDLQVHRVRGVHGEQGEMVI